ncbi:NmrA/HSCARG family protein [Staphylococcus warneri]|uniref:NmrA/HSCARG family protein n=1 Tax=Staphylococcus warneri TaxID=1292 RepID=UPI0032606A8E
MNSNNKEILVVGATGLQGGAVAHEALDQGFKVRILVRNENSEKAQSLIQKGAIPVVGDFNDSKSLDKAMQNIYGVFSVPISGIDTEVTDSERKQASAVIEAALKNNVEHFVHTSVAATSRYTEFPNWGTGYWYEKYWMDKWDIEEKVRNVGFKHWTILKPAMVMNNFYSKVEFMYPEFKDGLIKTSTYSDTKIDYIAVEDLAKFVVAAFNQPEKFDGHIIELASESLTYPEVAEIFTRITGKDVKSAVISSEDALAEGKNIYLVRSHEWDNEVGYQVDKEKLKQYGIQLTSFEEFVKQHKDDFIIE